MNIIFEWDEDKAQANLKKHHVSFGVAARVFLDPLALACQDRIKNGEYRWQTLGMVADCLLLVAHTVRQDEDGEVIRIISARKADKKEQRHYEKNR